MPKNRVMTPLADPQWRYVEKPSLDDFRAEDWAIINSQRGPYYAQEQAKQALRLLTASAEDPSFGYPINNYRHCLQSATMVMRDGQDEETIVVTLFHDIGFVACPDTHGAFSAALLRAYISEKNHWMLEHHGIFQQFHCYEFPNLDRHARDHWGDHPYFEWTAKFVEKYDQNAIQPDYDNAPIEVFKPMVHRLFSREPKQVP